MNEGKLHEQKSRGARANALLQNELLVQAFEGLEITLVEAWKNSTPDQVQRREDAWRSLALLKKLKKSLESHVHNGSVAEKQLIEIKKPSKLRKMING